MSVGEIEVQESRQQAYTNMFSNFAKNYAHTLETLVKQSEEYIKNKALNRRKMHKNEEVKN